MYSKTTKKINITVNPYYLEDQSEPEDQHYVWAYKVTIDNHTLDVHNFENCPFSLWCFCLSVFTILLLVSFFCEQCHDNRHQYCRWDV